MKVKTFKHPSILLASCWYLIHNSGAFFGYFIGILISDYCKTPQKIIFLAFSILTSPGKATLRVVYIKMPQSTKIMLLNILHYKLLVVGSIIMVIFIVYLGDRCTPINESAYKKTALYQNQANFCWMGRRRLFQCRT